MTATALLAGFLLMLPSQAFATFPGGNGEIVLSYEHHDSGDCGDMAHHICEIDESRLMLVRPNGRDLSVFRDCPSDCTETSPAWSPNGKRVAFARSASGTIWVAAVDGTHAQRLRDAYGGTPTWSPNGKQLAYAGNDGALYRVSLAHPKPRRITRPASLTGHEPDTNPTWCRGGAIAFNRSVDNRNDVYLLKATAHIVKRLTMDGAGPPDCSPGGKKLLYSTDAGTVVRRLAVGGGRRIVLPSPVFFPRWAPDATSIVYSDGHDAFVTKLRSSRTRRLTGGDHDGDFLIPAWRPLARADR